MKDIIGDRMKGFYEDRFRHKLLRRTYTIIRIDGKAFSTYTKGLKKPFDEDLIEDMNQTALYLCQNIQGAKLGYVQSDEISILVTDFDQLETQLWFDGNVQKIASVSASLATAKFNQLRFNRLDCRAVTHNGYDYVPNLVNVTLAHFDSRVFQIPTKTEVLNYFIWRQKDCIRNSVSSVAQTYFSPKQLHGVSTAEKIELLNGKNISWEDLDKGQKHGRIVVNELNTDFTTTSWNIYPTPIINFEPNNFMLSLVPENK